jgi:membrane protease YdiL (CAAX protease family)
MERDELGFIRGYVGSVIRETGVARRSTRHWGMRESFIGLVLAVVGMALLVKWLRSGVYFDTHFAIVLSYAVVWLPLIGACAYACLVAGTRSPIRDFAIRFTWIDVLFGVGIGLIARAFASILEIAAYGRMSGLGVTFGETVYDGWWVFGTIIAPVLVAPVLEEIFFRGMLQRAVRSVLEERKSGRTAIVWSVVASAVLFALLHLTETANPTAATVLGLSTLFLGIGTAALAAFTGRIGGSIVAHVTFNGSLILDSLLNF